MNNDTIARLRAIAANPSVSERRRMLATKLADSFEPIADSRPYLNQKFAASCEATGPQAETVRPTL